MLSKMQERRSERRGRVEEREMKKSLVVISLETACASFLCVKIAVRTSEPHQPEGRENSLPPLSRFSSVPFVDPSLSLISLPFQTLAGQLALLRGTRMTSLFPSIPSPAPSNGTDRTAPHPIPAATTATPLSPPVPCFVRNMAVVPEGVPMYEPGLCELDDSTLPPVGTLEWSNEVYRRKGYLPSALHRSSCPPRPSATKKLTLSSFLPISPSLLPRDLSSCPSPHPTIDLNLLTLQHEKKNGSQHLPSTAWTRSTSLPL
jgi:hypothetical protein